MPISGNQKKLNETNKNKKNKSSIKAQINNLTLHVKELEKEQQTKPKGGRRKEIIKIRAEINEINLKKNPKDQ